MLSTASEQKPEPLSNTVNAYCHAMSVGIVERMEKFLRVSAAEEEREYSILSDFLEYFGITDDARLLEKVTVLKKRLLADLAACCDPATKARYYIVIMLIEQLCGNKAKVLAYAEELLQMNNPIVFVQKGYSLFYQGEFAAAHKCFVQAIEVADSAYAYYWLHHLYEKNVSLEPYTSHGKNGLNIAAGKGYMPALSLLARKSYLQSDAKEADLQQAKEYILITAKSGIRHAMEDLGFYYETIKNYPDALYCYRIAYLFTGRPTLETRIMNMIKGKFSSDPMFLYHGAVACGKIEMLDAACKGDPIAVCKQISIDIHPSSHHLVREQTLKTVIDFPKLYTVADFSKFSSELTEQKEIEPVTAQGNFYRGFLLSLQLKHDEAYPYLMAAINAGHQLAGRVLANITFAKRKMAVVAPPRPVPFIAAMKECKTLADYLRVTDFWAQKVYKLKQEPLAPGGSKKLAITRPGGT